MMRKAIAHDAVLRTVEAARDEIVSFARELIRMPTVNPPGEAYEPCARLVGETLGDDGFDVDYYTATGRAEHSAKYPRVNVVGRRNGRSPRPTLHFNSHIDVVPVAHGWTVDPFAGVVRGDRLYGRGASDMKGGLASAVFAAACIRRAGIELDGTLEISGTVDEESGGWAGVAHLAEIGRLTSASVDYVIIPEPFGVDRICVGHRGVYWFEVITHGRIAHGSMPFLGINAIEHLGEVLHELKGTVQPLLGERVSMMPIVPEEARRASLNVNAIGGGQIGEDIQSPCVADRASAIFDRRFLDEESFEEVRSEIVAALERVRHRTPAMRYELVDRMVVHPVRLPPDSPLVDALSRSISELGLGSPTLVASPGTYDHKHVVRLGGIEQCVAYGPGDLEIAHQPDEWVSIDALVQSAQVMALAAIDLLTISD